jgi:hypothetical protein
MVGRDSGIGGTGIAPVAGGRARCEYCQYRFRARLRIMTTNAIAERRVRPASDPAEAMGGCGSGYDFAGSDRA